MSFLKYPDPAQRAKLLQAYLLRQQGLTLRQIAARMECAHSTVASYLKEFEFFRADLIHELAADQVVSHLIGLADVDDEHHDRRLAAVRELRLLLTALPGISRAETERTLDILRAGVDVDRYGNRYLKPERLHPLTDEEVAEAEQAEPRNFARPELDLPLAYRPEPGRTESNKAEQPPAPDRSRNGKSPRTARNSLPAPQSPLPRNTGRNRPCPCNSGKKRKHCHPESHSPPNRAR